MNIAKLMQLPYTSDYLKQYLIELAIVAVFSEVFSQIHSMFFKNKDCSISGEPYIFDANDVLAIFLFCFDEYQVFEVELLCKHIIQCEIIKAPQSKYIIFLNNCGHRIDYAFIDITSYGS